VVYVKSSIPAVLFFTSSSHEYLWIQINLPERPLFPCCLYSPPTADDSIYRKLLQDVSRIEESFSQPYFVVCGDFNCHHRTWLGHPKTDANGISAKLFSDECGFVQMTPFSTRDPTRGPDSILDLILTNLPNTHPVSISPALGSSDHLVVSWSSVIRTARQFFPSKRKVWMYDRADWDGLRGAMAEFPFAELSSGDVDDDWETFRGVFVDYIDCYIPSKWRRTVSEGSQLWFDENCEEAMRKKTLAFETWKANPTDSNRQAYRCARNRAISSFRRAKAAHILRVGEDLNSSSPSHRSWWHTVRQVTGRAVSSVPTLIANNKFHHSPVEKAKVLNSYMADQNSVPNPGAPLPPFNLSCDNHLNSTTFTPDIVLRQLSKLDSAKATGPDNIAARVIKQCAPEIAEPLANLFTLSFSRSRLPSQWKDANVIPVFKKGERSCPSNYRPISLLCIVSKVMERIVADNLRSYLFRNNLISQRQFGFRPGHSSLDLLLTLSQKWNDALNNGWEVRAVSLDISRAFDTVWHAALLGKLNSLGIEGSLLAWITDFLYGRRQRVVLDGFSSEFRNVNAGVPQGSVLGPLLFLIYINDLGQHLENDLYLFADDSTLFRIIRKTGDRISAAESLNRDLDRILHWSRTWNMSFNPSKFQAITFSLKRMSAQRPLHFSGFSITDNTTLKLLGVIFSSDLSWRGHLSTVSERATRQLGALRRAKRYLSRRSLVILYKSIVRSTLEYCCPLWVGSPASHLDILNRIQRRGTSILGLSSEKLHRF